MTDVLEDNTRTFTDNWTGTGTIESTGGDAERLVLDPTEYMISEVVDTGTYTVELLQNNYAVGDTVGLQYRHGATAEACALADWTDYTVPFDSLGFVQVKVEAPA